MLINSYYINVDCYSSTFVEEIRLLNFSDFRELTVLNCVYFILYHSLILNSNDFSLIVHVCECV